MYLKNRSQETQGAKLQCLYDRFVDQKMGFLWAITITQNKKRSESTFVAPCLGVRWFRPGFFFSAPFCLGRNDEETFEMTWL